jgi:hypothetical protein
MSRYPLILVVGVFVAVLSAGCSSQPLAAPDPVLSPTPAADRGTAPGATGVDFSSSLSALTAQSAADRDTKPVFWIGGSIIPGSSSLLIRNDGGVTAAFHTSGLTAGNAYTMWFVVFNNRSACLGPAPPQAPGAKCGFGDLGRAGVNSSIMYAAGHVVGDGDADNLAGRRGVGDTDGVIAGPGLLNPRGAEIHLVVRNHGPAIPGLIKEQISSFNGGCPPNSCTNVQASVHPPS